MARLSPVTLLNGLVSSSSQSSSVFRLHGRGLTDPWRLAGRHLARQLSSTPLVYAGGKNKIRVSGKGKLKDHRLGGPGMEEAFDIERDLAKPFAMQDVPGVTHLRWAEARKRLHALRLIKFQMPLLAKHRQPFVPPPPEAHLIVRTHDDLGFHKGKHESQRPNRKVSIQVNLSKIPVLRDSPRAMHKLKVLSGKRYFEPERRSPLDLSDHYNDPNGWVKISCDKFPSRLMNARWCSDTLDRLIEASTGAQLEEDPMEDIPLDQVTTLKRRRRNKTRPWSADPQVDPKFPKQWLTPQVTSRLESFQAVKKKLLMKGKEELSKSAEELRKVTKWDGLGIAPVGLFQGLSDDAKQRIVEIVEKQHSVRESMDKVLGCRFANSTQFLEGHA